LLKLAGFNNIQNKDKIRQLSLFFILIVIVVAFSLMSEMFFNTDNILNILRQVSITMIAAVGMSLIILMGDIDLSVGSVFAFLGVIMANVFLYTNSTFLAVVVALVAGGIIGMISGLITAKGKIPAFVTTLAIMSVLRGAAYIMTGGRPISVMDESFTFFGTGYIGNVIPVPIVIMIIVIAVGVFITKNTRFGRYVYALGGNEQTSKWSGINTVKIKIMVYTFAGVLYGLSALILCARLGSGQPNTGQGAEMDVITAVILGGTSLSGGKGTIIGTMIGVMIIGVLNNGLTLLDVSSYWQQVIKGIIIIAAVLFDTRSKNKA
jgi:ribose transport system permease protein